MQLAVWPLHAGSRGHELCEAIEPPFSGSDLAANPFTAHIEGQYYATRQPKYVIMQWLYFSYSSIIICTAVLFFQTTASVSLFIYVTHGNRQLVGGCSFLDHFRAHTVSRPRAYFLQPLFFCQIGGCSFQYIKNEFVFIVRVIYVIQRLA